MQILKPQTATELAAALMDCASTGRHIRVFGSSSKDRMGGPLADAETGICTSAMKRLLQYEPRDLTISVEAGMPFAELSRLLADNRQMIPIDPPYFDTATVGGIVAASTSGPRRRLYGSVRDLIIGMTFATLEGKLVNSGGMVVKNVAGLDMGKLMAGSFGTLAVLGVVNFKLLPIPEISRTFVMRFATIDEAIARRDEILKGVLLPAALDLLNPAGAKRVGLEGYCLIFQAGGNTAVMDRYVRELPGQRGPGRRRRNVALGKHPRVHAPFSGGTCRGSRRAGVVHADGTEAGSIGIRSPGAGPGSERYLLRLFRRRVAGQRKDRKMDHRIRARIAQALPRSLAGTGQRL